MLLTNTNRSLSHDVSQGSFQEEQPDGWGNFLSTRTDVWSPVQPWLHTPDHEIGLTTTNCQIANCFWYKFTRQEGNQNSLCKVYKYLYDTHTKKDAFLRSLLSSLLQWCAIFWKRLFKLQLNVKLISATLRETFITSILVNVVSHITKQSSTWKLDQSSR